MLRLVTILCFSWSMLAAAPVSKNELDKVVGQMDRLWIGNSFAATVRMHIQTAHYSRTLGIKYWIDGQKRTLVEVTKPIKEKGTATLKNDRQIYNYLPKIGRTVKVSSALLAGSWMGSHFNNDDLVKFSSSAEDYTSKFLSTKIVNGREQWRVRMTPNPDAAVEWSKIEMEINRTDLLPVAAEYFDEDGKKVRTISYSKLKKMDGRILPTVIRVTPHLIEGEYTELVYESLKRNIKYNDGFFSLTKFRNR